MVRDTLFRVDTPSDKMIQEIKTIFTCPERSNGAKKSAKLTNTAIIETFTIKDLFEVLVYKVWSLQRQPKVEIPLKLIWLTILMSFQRDRNREAVSRDELSEMNLQTKGMIEVEWHHKRSFTSQSLLSHKQAKRRILSQVLSKLSSIKNLEINSKNSLEEILLAEVAEVAQEQEPNQALEYSNTMRKMNIWPIW